MHWSRLLELQDRIPEPLRHLARPAVYWYPSAALDLRPLVYVLPPYQREVAARDGAPGRRLLPPPDLWVYTCLPDHHRRRLHPGLTLYEDAGVTIRCADARENRLDRGRVRYAIDRRWARFGQDPRRRGAFDATLARLTITSRAGLGTFDAHVLYLSMENNNAFDALFCLGVFDLRLICATREGLGMGGCGRSVITHLYRDDGVERARAVDAEPRWVITWADFTDAVFREHAGRRYPNLRRWGSYLSGRHTPHHVYALFGDDGPDDSRDPSGGAVEP